jgi:hypothetical protein
MPKVSTWVAVLLIGIAALGVANSAHAQDYAMVGGDRYFRLEWEPAVRHGHPEVRGNIFNEWGETAQRIRLRVESLNQAGQVTAVTEMNLPGQITPGTHAFFEVPVPAPAPAYRVSVIGWDWVIRGGGIR